MIPNLRFHEQINLGQTPSSAIQVGQMPLCDIRNVAARASRRVITMTLRLMEFIRPIRPIGRIGLMHPPIPT